MFLSRWTLYQGIIIALLIIIAFIADMFNKDIGVPFSSPNVLHTPVLMTSIFIVAIIGLFSLTMYFQVKKSHTFLRHRLWDKMYILMPVIIGISLIVVFTLFLVEPLNALIQSNRWLIYALIFYTLFLINVTVLSMVHKVKRNTISNENKIYYSFIWTSLGLLVAIFMV